MGLLAFIFLIGIATRRDGQAAMLTLPAVVLIPLFIALSLYWAVWPLRIVTRTGWLLLLGNVPIIGFLSGSTLGAEGSGF